MCLLTFSLLRAEEAGDLYMLFFLFMPQVISTNPDTVKGHHCSPTQSSQKYQLHVTVDQICHT